jgi:hypothetical protein
MSSTFKVYNIVLDELLNLELINNPPLPPSYGNLQIIDLTNIAPISPNPLGLLNLGNITENTSYLFINDSVDQKIVTFDSISNGVIVSFSRIKGSTDNTAIISIGKDSPLIDVTLSIALSPVRTDTYIIQSNGTDPLTVSAIGGNVD